MYSSLMTKREHIINCILQRPYFTKTFKELRTYKLMAKASGHINKQEITKIKNDLSLIKNEVLNTLTDNIPYIENCMMTTSVRNGKLIVEIIDGRTMVIMKTKKQEDEGNIQ